MSSSIECLGIIGKANNPLYITSTATNEEDEITFHEMLYVSLDVVEERLGSSSGGSRSADAGTGWLKQLQVWEDYSLYGYVTNSRTKFILVVLGDPKLSALLGLFKKLHQTYSDYSCNPFYVNEEPITSRKFDRKIRASLGFREK